MSVVELPIDLLPWQKAVDISEARFKLIKAGRQTGKTRYSVYWQVREALLRPAIHWHLSPTYKTAKEDAWPALLAMVPSDVRVRVRLGEHSVELTNGSKIYIKSSDQPDNLRGGKLGSVVMEEADFQREAVWSDVIRAKLLALRAPALFISSPKPDWFCRLRARAARGELGSDWVAFHYTVYDNPTLSLAEIDAIRASESETTWRREYMAEELEDQVRVYPEFSDSCIFDSRDGFPDHLAWPCIQGIDWGFDDPTALVTIHVSPSGELVLSDEYEKSGLDVEAHCVTIKERSSFLRVRHRVLSSDAFSHFGDQRSTIADRFRASGIPCREATRKKESSVDMMRRLMRGWGGKPGLHVSSRCRNFIKHVRLWEHDHHEPDILQAARYAIWEAINSGMTGILTLPRSLSLSDKPFISRLPIPARRNSGSLRWDFEYGVPLNG